MGSKKKQNKKEKGLAAASGVSGSLSFLGGWQICHNLCLGIIALLGFFGIAVQGMPLLFLTQYSIYFWSAAAIFLIPTLIMRFSKNCCMPKNLVLFNIGIVIFSIPFLQELSLVFWTIGGLFIILSAISFLKNRGREKIN